MEEDNPCAGSCSSGNQLPHMLVKRWHPYHFIPPPFLSYLVPYNTLHSQNQYFPFPKHTIPRLVTQGINICLHSSDL